MDNIEELLDIVKTLPEQGKIEFMAILSELNDNNLDPMKATDLISDLLEKYTPKVVN